MTSCECYGLLTRGPGSLPFRRQVLYAPRLFVQVEQGDF
jgi:hypothetical protein